MAGRVGRRIYKTKAWRELRLAVFRRDGFKCVTCGRRSALECDHIRPIAKAGDWLDMGNLQTLCRACHIAKTAAARLGQRLAVEPRAELAAMALEGR